MRYVLPWLFLVLLCSDSKIHIATGVLLGQRRPNQSLKEYYPYAGWKKKFNIYCLCINLFAC